MESTTDEAPLVVIVGETASGKTALAIEIAKRFNGEIIAADSRTVYKGMDIGTAKPTAQERQAVPHHLLDVVTPDQHFSAAQFKQLALEAIAAISRHGHLPILVGGTGLYIDAVLYDFAFGKLPDIAERTRLQMLSVPELQQILRDRGIPLPENTQNPRHLIRATENGGVVQSPHTLRPNTLVLGLTIDRQELTHKLQARVRAMVAAGFIEETKHLAAAYGWDAPGMQSTGYKAAKAYCQGLTTLDQLQADFVRNDLQLAKRQRTWFKRNKSIHWISKQEDAVDLVTTFMNKK